MDYSLFSLHFAYFARHKRNPFSGQKRELFRKKTWKKKKQLLEHFIQTSSWNFIWQVMSKNITHNLLKKKIKSRNFYYQSLCPDLACEGQILRWYMLFLPQSSWVSWSMELSQDFRSWMTSGSIMGLVRNAIILQKEQKLRSNSSCEFFSDGNN